MAAAVFRSSGGFGVIYKNPSAFGVRHIRNIETISRFLPTDYCDELFCLDKSFDADFSEEINKLWEDVASAVHRWKE